MALSAGAPRAVLVTGASKGFGRAIALRLVRAGFTVFAGVRREADRARELCEKLLAIAGSLRLYAEEIEPKSGRHLGNFPQAFTHLALINAVMHVIRADEARELFERLLDLRNDVGLLSEEYDPVAGRQLGNFPQAFTHLALITAVLDVIGIDRFGRRGWR